MRFGNPELDRLLDEHHAHVARGGAASGKAGFDGLVADLHAAGERLSRRAPTMAKAVPTPTVVPMKNLVGELAAMANAASASAEAAARRAAAARAEQRRTFQAKFAQADQVLKAMIAGGRLTAEQVAVAEIRMGQLARGLR